jgi:DNA-binding PadR family transcriptional regulator
VATDLSPGEWAVLGAVAEAPTHGFALAQLLASDGQLGRIWTLPRPMVYQVVQKLLGLGLIRARRTERSDRGPVRTVVGVTPAGRAALRKWLEEPVDHVRDVRSLLLLKLALLERSGGNPAPLIKAQSQKLAQQLSALEQARDEAEGFERVILEWRIASSRATVEFLAAVKAGR